MQEQPGLTLDDDFISGPFNEEAPYPDRIVYPDRIIHTDGTLEMR